MGKGGRGGGEGRGREGLETEGDKKNRGIRGIRGGEGKGRGRREEGRKEGEGGKGRGEITYIPYPLYIYMDVQKPNFYVNNTCKCECINVNSRNVFVRSSIKESENLYKYPSTYLPNVT